MDYVLALDQGTTSTRAIIFDTNGGIVASAQQEFRQLYPKLGWVEHSPKDIMGSAVGVISEALVRANLTAAEISAMGITNQRETTFVWDRKTGKPVCNAIVWQCRRTADYCKKLKDDGFAEKIYNKTGLVPDAYFSATKIKWILDNIEGARARAERGELLFGTVDTFILWQLSKGRIFATDYTNASRTMLFNIHTLKWDTELLRLFDIPSSMLPEVHPSGHFYGETDKSFFGSPIPVCGVAGDQQAALFGQTCFEAGDVKNTYGTGCFLLMNTGRRAVKSRNGLVTTLGAGLTDKPDYVLEGSVFVGGAVVQWLRDEMKIISSAEDSENKARSVADSGGVYIVPAFTGLGAPYWDPAARGLLTGITRGTSRAHVVRAVLESIAYGARDLSESMEEDSGIFLREIRCDGGASANGFLMQFQADVSGVRIDRPAERESTALGAALMCAVSRGLIGLEDVPRLRRNGKTFYPAKERAEYDAAFAKYRSAVRRALISE